MILSEYDIPEKNIFYVGSLILKLFTSSKEILHIDDLYFKYKAENEKSVEMLQFLLAIDWLFLIGLVSYDEKNMGFVLCN